MNNMITMCGIQIISLPEQLSSQHSTISDIDLSPMIPTGTDPDPLK